MGSRAASSRTLGLWRGRCRRGAAERPTALRQGRPRGRPPSLRGGELPRATVAGRAPGGSSGLPAILKPLGSGSPKATRATAASQPGGHMVNVELIRRAAVLVGVRDGARRGGPGGRRDLPGLGQADRRERGQGHLQDARQPRRALDGHLVRRGRADARTTTARGTEKFQGCLDRRRNRSCKGDPSGTLSFTFDYWALFGSDEEPSSGAPAGTRCVSGTGAFAGAAGCS